MTESTPTDTSIANRKLQIANRLARPADQRLREYKYRFLVVSALAVALYGYSLISAAHGVVAGRLLFRPLLFHACVILLAAWTGWRWWRMARTITAGAGSISS
jgi:hypothetical protein